jgi:hypothetical protein
MRYLRNRRLPWTWICLAGLPAAILVVFTIAGGASAQESTPAPSGTPEPAAILSPLPNEALRGIVPVTVRIDLPDVQTVELTFGYSGDPTRTWFFISQVDGPVPGEKLADWDTTTLTDGNYTLRLVVTRQDGSQVVARAVGLRVRNYSPIETDTPVPTATPAPGEPPPPTLTPTRSPTPIFPTPTPLPGNPIQLSTQDLASSLMRGALGAVMVFALLGLYARVRSRLGR